MSPPLSRNVNIGRLRQRKFAEIVFNRRFPQRSDTQKHFVVRFTNRIPKKRQQTQIGGNIPEKNVRVEKQFHQFSKFAKTSSGKGASKSSGTTKSPLLKPNGRKSFAVVSSSKIVTITLTASRFFASSGISPLHSN